MKEQHDEYSAQVLATPLHTQGMHFPSFYTPVPGSCFKAFNSLPPSESKTKNSKEITESVLLNPSLFLPFPPLSVTATTFVPFGKGGYANGAELGCTY